MREAWKPHEVTRCGKEIKVNGQRFCDATSILHAELIECALRDYFHVNASKVLTSG